MLLVLVLVDGESVAGGEDGAADGSSTLCFDLDLDVDDSEIVADFFMEPSLLNADFQLADIDCCSYGNLSSVD